jgi:hypothetical protein
VQSPNQINNPLPSFKLGWVVVTRPVSPEMQTHLLSKEMLAERDHYIKDLANRLNVRWQDDITVPKTRNPLGQYSDEGCIIATQEYTLPNNHDF